MGTDGKMALDTSFGEGRIRLLGGRRSGRRDIKSDKEEMNEKDKEKRKEIMRIVYVLLFHTIKLREVASGL